MEVADTLDTLAALAHETRLRVYRLLAAAGPDGLNAGEVAAQAKVAPTSLSGHLNILARAGVVSKEKQGSFVVYRARPEKVKALARLLVDG